MLCKYKIKSGAVYIYVGRPTFPSVNRAIVFVDYSTFRILLLSYPKKNKLCCWIWSDAVDLLTKLLGMPYSVVTAQQACKGDRWFRWTASVRGRNSVLTGPLLIYHGGSRLAVSPAESWKKACVGVIMNFYDWFVILDHFWVRTRRMPASPPWGMFLGAKSKMATGDYVLRNMLLSLLETLFWCLPPCFEGQWINWCLTKVACMTNFQDGRQKWRFRPQFRPG